jgi:endonuclease G
MAPAGDVTYSVDAMRESFYLSNMAPQVGIGFNRHIWADLEGLVRDWTCDRGPKGTLVAISGPIYDDEPPAPLNKKDDKVALPTHFYKIAYDPKARRAIAFILPNKKIDTKGRRVEDALQPYIVSVRDVEARAGLDFFAAFPRSRQAAIEANKAAIWAVHSQRASNTIAWILSSIAPAP